MTHDELKQLFDYNPDTGVLTWKLRRRGRNGRPGTVAGSLHSSGYIYVKAFEKSYKAHRLIWCYVYGDWPTMQIDHINRVKTDNRLSNLRLATPSENSRNRGVTLNLNPGITWDASRSKWRVQIRVGGRNKSIGRFDSLEAAKAALAAQ